MNALLSLLAQENQSSGGSLIIFLPVLALLVYMMIVPQRKQKKKQAEMMAALRVGDEVLTSGGIYGTVSFLEDKVAHIVVDTDVVIRVTKSSLTRLTPTTDDDAEDTAADVVDATGTADGEAEAPPSKSSKSPKP